MPSSIRVRIEKAKAELEPASQERVIKLLAPVLALTAPAGFTEGDRKAWLTAALDALRGIPEDLLRRGLDTAKKWCDHPSKIVPAIMREIEHPWDWRKTELQLAQGSAFEALPPPQTDKQEDVCTPEQARAIMEEMGIPPSARTTVTRVLGNLRTPTRQDYIDLGVDPSVLDQDAA